MIRRIKVNNQLIEYDLTIKKVKNINLRIKRDNSIKVSANKQVPIHMIEDFITKKSDFIISVFNKNKLIQPSIKKSKTFLDGEKFGFLGNELELKVLSSSSNRVMAAGGNLFVFIKNAENSRLKEKLISSFIRQECKTVFVETAKSIFPIFESKLTAFPQIKLRKMTSQWGNCRPKTMVITLNTKLIETPITCIEYVVMHEFVHFIHPNHSKEFYSLLEASMPDWKARKSKLDKYII